MQRLTSIVALNEDGAIGAGNALPWRIKSDLRFFRKMTLGNVIIMGRKTYDSLGGCLPERDNIVVTHRFALFSQTPRCVCSGGIIEALARAERSKTKRQEVFIVGGATMYEQFAPYVDRYLITEVRKPVPNADTYFDRATIGEVENWNFRVIQEGRANDAGDEADFRIFELTARNQAEIGSRRQGEIYKFLARHSSAEKRAFQEAARLTA